MTSKTRVEGSLMGNRAKPNDLHRKDFFTDLYEIQIPCFWVVRGVSTWEVRQENQEAKLVFSYVTISSLAWATSHGTLTRENKKSILLQEKNMRMLGLSLSHLHRHWLGKTVRGTDGALCFPPLPSFCQLMVTGSWCSPQTSLSGTLWACHSYSKPTEKHLPSVQSSSLDQHF